MFDDLIRQLQDFDPNARRTAIIALGKTKNASALRPLAEVVLKDSDPELRDLARKAGIYIRRETGLEAEPTAPRRRIKQTGTLPQATTPEPDFNPRRRGVTFMQEQADDREINPRLQPEEMPTDGKGPVRGKTYRVPPAAVSRAHAYTEAALTDHTDGRKSRAMKNLTEALSLNPNLINDDYYNNVAAIVTGLSNMEAMASIVNPAQRDRFIDEEKQVEKKRVVDAHLSTVRQTTGTDFYFELAIYCLIMVVGPVIIGILLIQGIGGFLNTVVTTSAANPEVGTSEEMIATLQGLVNGFSLGSLLLIGFGSLLTGLMSFFIQMGLVHFLATSVFNGMATLRHLLTTVLRFYNRLLPIIFAVIGFGILIGFFTVGSLVVFCPVIILVLLTLFVLFRTGGKIGEAYGFGGVIGSLTLFLSSILLSLILGVIGAFVLQATGLALESLIDLGSLTLPPTS